MAENLKVAKTAAELDGDEEARSDRKAALRTQNYRNRKRPTIKETACITAHEREHFNQMKLPGLLERLPTAKRVRKTDKKRNPTRTLKQRIRDLKRQLAHVSGLAADVRVEHERELAAVQHDLGLVIAERHKKDMISRYHMVRFFDRVKAERRRKAARKEFCLCSNDNPDKDRLRHLLHLADVDLNYTKYFPLKIPYSSLTPRKPDKEGYLHSPQPGPKGDREIWAVVEESMQQGTLDKLRNSVLTRDALLERVLGYTKSGIALRHRESMPAVQKDFVDHQSGLNPDADMDGRNFFGDD